MNGNVVSEELFYAWGGKPIPEIIATLNRQQGLAMPADTVAEQRESYYRELLPD